MTFKLSERYPGRVDEPSDGYPRGSFKNRSAPGAEDGTYLEKDWKNDERGFFDAIVINAGIEPNGEVDTGLNSQLYDGLLKIIDSRIATGSATLYGAAGGTSDNITVTLNRDVMLANGAVIYVRATYANTSTAPTIKVGDNAAKAIVKGNNLPLLKGDIAGAGFIMHLAYDAAFDRWILLNPAFGVGVVETIPVGTIAYFGRTGTIPGWLLMDATEHNRADYAALVAACPDLILPGSTSATFKLKDPRGYFLRVLDGGSGRDPSRSFASTQGDAMRNLTGTIKGCNEEDAGECTGVFRRAGTSAGGKGGFADYNVSFDASRQVPVANEFRPKNFALPVYIKY